MKRSPNLIRHSILPIAIILIAAVFFTSCKKDVIQQNNNTPAAGLMAFNLSDKAAAGFTLSGNTFGNPLSYTNFTGAYLPVFVGSREVRSFDYNTGSTLAITTNNFADSMYYSAFLLGANGNYRNVVVKDDLIPLTVSPGKAWVRYINAIPDSTSAPVVTISNGDGSIHETAPYGNVSSFKQVNVGSVNATISNGSNISANRTITFEENKVYTVLFVGIPGSTDADKSVQIRFITNGTVTP